MKKKVSKSVKNNNKILIIDDEEAQLKTLTDILELNGFSVFSSSSENDALKIAKEEVVNVAILDLRLGSCDGITVLNKLKKINPLMNIIINTGYASLDTAISALNLNAFAYVKKAGNIEQLLILVNKAFNAYYEKYNDVLKKEVKKKTDKLVKVNKELKDELFVRGRLENEIVKLNKDLSDRVYKRTEELEEAVKELESFSYTVSHDLRSPLRHINSYIEILNEDMKNILTDDNREKMKIISDSAKRLGDLTDSLLDFLKKNKTDLSYSKINLDQLLISVINDFTTEINERKIIWNIGIMHEVSADSILLRQVWYNLISNALKYTAGCIEAVIEIGCFDMGKDKLGFFIKDNGIGFDMRYVHKLFGVFQRLHNSNEYSGVGIGLANVKRIVMRHGGKVWAEGRLSKGASFYFTLPNIK